MKKSCITSVHDLADRPPCYKIDFVAFCDVFVSNSMLTESISTVNRFTGKVRFILLDFSLTVKAATLIFISGCGLTISSAKEEKSDFIYNLVKS